MSFQVSASDLHNIRLNEQETVSLLRLRHLEAVLQRVKDVFAEISALEELWEELSGTAESLETTISDVNSALSELIESKASELWEEMLGENGAVLSLDAGITELRDEVFGKGSEPGALGTLEAALREEILGENGAVPAANAEIDSLRSEVLGEGGAVESLDARISEEAEALNTRIEEELLGESGTVQEIWNTLAPLAEAFPAGVVALYRFNSETCPPPGWAWYETDSGGAPLPASDSRPEFVYIVKEDP